MVVLRRVRSLFSMFGGFMIKVSFDDLIIGNEYYTKCGIWEGKTVYVGSFLVGKRVFYRFTYGSLDNWSNQFGHFCTKSRIKVFTE